MSITRKYGGTGLGLSLVKQLVEAHGGRISVKSKENMGTTFFFSLKVAHGTALACPCVRLRLSMSATAKPPAGSVMHPAALPPLLAAVGKQLETEEHWLGCCGCTQIHSEHPNEVQPQGTPTDHVAATGEHSQLAAVRQGAPRRAPSRRGSFTDKMLGQRKANNDTGRSGLGAGQGQQGGGGSGSGAGGTGMQGAASTAAAEDREEPGSPWPKGGGEERLGMSSVEGASPGGADA